MAPVHNAHLERLRKIRTFPSLVAYLRDELEWPIESASFDDLLFEYTPEELGIDAKNAAKIEAIKQLRPLATGQPWGIFFVEFTPRRLPVVALRRILSKLIFRKRQSGNPAERASWEKHDLLFISSYGESSERQITFAHFTDNAGVNDLDTLKVLGWDNDDTVLTLDHVHETLHERLRWPKDPGDTAAWRAQWRGAFELRHREVITSSKQLATRLAELATSIRRRCTAALRVEAETGPLTTLMNGFREALIHDLTPDDFADMYAQTIAYGLLSARASRPAGFIAENLADMVPVTNPFLKDLMQTFLNVGGRKWNERKGKLTGIDFDELGINDVVETLREHNIEAILRDFGNRTATEDPVIYFYEDFLKAYDAKKRMQRGVFYTPRPVVSYIVRSVHELLQTEFGLPDGLADTTTWGEMLKKHKGLKLPEIDVVDEKTRKVSRKPIDPGLPFVQILDPATGTATFLVEVIDVIHKTMVAKWKKEKHPDLWIDRKWNEYVPKHLLPRLHGYELMMAPYAIAHMKIGLKLFETGYKFGSGERARIYLTNALEPAQDFSDTFEQMAPALAHEAKAVNDVKRHQRFTVVIANPPYSGESANPSEFADGTATSIGRLLRNYFFVDGQPLGERNSKWLHDDYVKFIRFAEHLIESAGRGALGYITNHSFLFNPTFRGMRQHLMTQFDRLDTLNLHGSMKLRERAPDGGADENVFDIEPGTAITLARRTGSRKPIRRSGDLWGARATKYERLTRAHPAELADQQFEPAPPFYLLFPQEAVLREEFQRFMSLTEMMPLNNTGIITKRDGLTIHHSAGDVWKTVTEFLACPPSSAHAQFDLPEDVRDWSVERAQADLRSTGLTKARISRICYRPFDVRYSYYTGNSRGFVGWPVDKIYRHMVAGPNLALCIGRAGQVIDQGEWNIVFCTRHMTEFNLFRRGGNVVFPLYIYRESLSAIPTSKVSVTSNVSNAVLSRFSVVEVTLDSEPQKLLQYIYALLHAPGYRARYAEFLKIDFPRIPPPSTSELFEALTELGDEIVALHLMESPRLEKLITAYIGLPQAEVEKVTYANQTVWLDKKQTCGFAGVPEAVWNFHIGGYQVCEKWLKDRKGRTLSTDDIAHYQKIVVALSETIRLMKEIDEVIEKHGGWPGAFVTAPPGTA
jgi:hypothetical protein